MLDFRGWWFFVFSELQLRFVWTLDTGSREFGFPNLAFWTGGTSRFQIPGGPFGRRSKRRGFFFVWGTDRFRVFHWWKIAVEVESSILWVLQVTCFGFTTNQLVGSAYRLKRIKWEIYRNTLLFRISLEEAIQHNVPIIRAILENLPSSMDHQHFLGTKRFPVEDFVGDFG